VGHQDPVDWLHRSADDASVSKRAYGALKNKLDCFFFNVLVDTTKNRDCAGEKQHKLIPDVGILGQPRSGASTWPRRSTAGIAEIVNVAYGAIPLPAGRNAQPVSYSAQGGGKDAFWNVR